MHEYGKLDGGFGTNVKVQQSTGVTYDAVWLFIRNSPNGPVKGALHLDKREAKRLRNMLDDFIWGSDA